MEGTLEFPLVHDCHQGVLERLLAQASATGLSACAPEDLRLIVEEVLTNVVKYSGAAERGASGTVRWRMWPDRLELAFEDPGDPFDPLGEDEDDLSDDERCEGGMGILLIRALASEVGYRREDGRNRLLLTFTGV